MTRHWPLVLIVVLALWLASCEASLGRPVLPVQVTPTPTLIPAPTLEKLPTSSKG